MTFLIIFFIFCILLSFIYVKFKIIYKFWSDLSVPFVKPIFPVGNFGRLLKSPIHFDYILQNHYQSLKFKNGKIDYGGIYLFGDPAILVLSPEFAKRILVQDFQYFTDRGIYYNEPVDPLSANLFFIGGLKWKRLREKLTPTFTSGKLKQMFSTIKDVGDNLKNYLQEYAQNQADVDVKDLFGRFMTDIIASVAFGIDSNCIVIADSQFRRMGKNALNFSKMKALKIVIASAFPEKATKLGIRWVDKETSDYFIDVVKDTISHRKETGIKRNDFMQLLIELQNSGYGDNTEPLTFLEVAAQAFIFFLAGFETSSTTMTFALYLLAQHPDIQEKVREEIKSVLENHDGQWSYEAVMEMNYLGQIIDETLRLYPPVAQLHRTAAKDYKLPNGSYLPKGTAVFIPVLSFHRDGDNFPDPLKFDPDRFSQEQKFKRQPYSYLPFGEGMRNCIGMRFGLLQTRLGLAMILSEFKFSFCQKTENPIKIETCNLTHGPAGSVWLKVENN